MTNEEAIELITCVRREGTFSIAEFEAVKLAIQALEKQIARKPIKKHYEDDEESPYIKYKCPNECGSKYQLFQKVERYCINCGQKLDWSDR